MMSGKGSRRRKCMVSRAEEERRWAMIRLGPEYRKKGGRRKK